MKEQERELYERLIASIPEELIGEEVAAGMNLTAVRSGERVGLAATMRSNKPHHAPEVRNPGALAGRSLKELARLIHDGLPGEGSVAMAAINAGLPLGGLSLQEGSGVALLEEKAADMNLVVVGRFPFAHRLAPRTQSTSILELDPGEGELPASAADRVIPEADVVVITGSAFANRTIGRLLGLSRGKWVLVLGPTTPLSPVLFDYGVSVIAGAVPEDPELTMRQVKEGAIFRQLERVRKVLLMA